jgi:hypothetical protein
VLLLETITQMLRITIIDLSYWRQIVM